MSDDGYKNLEYRIFQCSSYSSSYIPEYVNRNTLFSNDTLAIANTTLNRSELFYVFTFTYSQLLKRTQFSSFHCNFQQSSCLITATTNLELCLSQRQKSVHLTYLMTFFSIKVTEFLVFRNIIIDQPSDQSSRWSSDNDNHPQVDELNRYLAT